ncbi:hypothetical protein DOTSEDRAFT_68427 [Dothistroma septosporum NZE10]|uniref:Heterokaryon incompatibility domain-containing protein n=1 Tax=Dothistroma septosporum (strain NZE10 / CBS 128990) TaxID=675120 RepID=N1Q1T9_DOTSN|nr:hypothetical protein DOTSEDRAFT_68427 [Dothistroma septosporum NZE10]
MSLTRWKSPATTASELHDFHYARLKSQNSIRLARLKPGSGGRVAIDLVDSYVAAPGQRPFEQYDALSYTWGELQPDKTILCNGRRLVITGALLEALKHFRHQFNEVTLWIDQLCICQVRPKEREHQVQLMGDIFSGARRVLVWLGGHYDDSRTGMRLAEHLLSITKDSQLASLDHDRMHSRLPASDHKGWNALAAILRRPWFLRTWIVQEVALNPHVVLMLGDNTLHWHELEAIVCMLEGPTPRQWYSDLTMSAWELPFSRINRIRMRHQQSHSSLTTTADPGIEADRRQDLDLLDLLLISRDLGATDPRDKIYGLLGLSGHQMPVDYEASPEQVFNEFALGIVGSATELAPAGAQMAKLSCKMKQVCKALILLSCAGKPNQQRSLASWIPDWSTNLSSRPLLFDQRFCAGGDSLHIDWHYETGLHLHGKLLDMIAVAGTITLGHSADSDAHGSIRDWIQEARRIADTRSVRSPGSTINVDAFNNLLRNLSVCSHGYYKDEEQESQTRRRRSMLDDTNEDAIHDARQTLMLGPTRGRVLAVTSTGYTCLVPWGAMDGDLIYVVLGASVPFVLRPHDEDPEIAFTLIGEAYVEGVMHGEHLQLDHLTGVEDVYLR